MLFYGSYTGRPLALLLNFNAVTFDFLIQSRQRDFKIVGGVGLDPLASLEHFDDHASLDDIHDIEKRAFLSE